MSVATHKQNNLEVVGFINAHCPHVINIVWTSVSYRIWACFTHTLIKWLPGSNKFIVFMGCGKQRQWEKVRWKALQSQAKDEITFPRVTCLGVTWEIRSVGAEANCIRRASLCGAHSAWTCQSKQTSVISSSLALKCKSFAELPCPMLQLVLEPLLLWRTV